MKALKLTVKIIEYILMVLLLAILVIGVLFLLKKLVYKEEMPELFGISNSVVVSGSMEPTLDVSDWIVVHRQDDYKVGDIITFKSNSNYVTHRIVDITDSGFVTKGDANNAEDIGTVSISDVKGKVVFIFPHFGSLLEWLTTPSGLVIIAAVIIILLIIPSLVNRFSKDSDEEK